MPFDHDPPKARSNLRTHGIDLSCCREAFDAPTLTREDPRDRYGEQRLASLGRVALHVVVLVWTDRPEGPRLISCRKATPHEREAYFRAYPPN